MKKKFHLIVLFLAVMGLAACSNEAIEPQTKAADSSLESETPLTRSARGAYYITSAADLAEFNELLEYAPTLTCVLAYEKTELLESDLPTDKNSIAGVDMPNLKSVKANMFSNCKSLTFVNLPECTYVGSGGFSNCSALVSVALPKCTIMEDQAFWVCTSLQTVDLPKCVVLGHSVFFRCSSLERVNLPKCTEIEHNVFALCISLTTVDLSSAIAVGYMAFANCSSLESINLPVCRTFGDYVFNNCTKLRSLRLWTLYAITASNLSFEGFNRNFFPTLNPNGVEFFYPPACGTARWKGVEWGNPGPRPGCAGYEGEKGEKGEKGEI